MYPPYWVSSKEGTFQFIWVPFYGLYVAFMLCAEKGTEGENRYGPDPLAEEGVHS